MAHGEVRPDTGDRVLVAVFASPVARYLLRYGADLGFAVFLLEPAAERAAGWTDVAPIAPADLDGRADVVVTDHHREELGPVLRDVLAAETRWVGVMGNPRHPAPHVPALRALGVPEDDIARGRDRKAGEVVSNLGGRRSRRGCLWRELDDDDRRPTAGRACRTGTGRPGVQPNAQRLGIVGRQQVATPRHRAVHPRPAHLLERRDLADHHLGHAR